MCEHRILTEPLGEMMRDPLAQAPGIDEHERRALGADQLGQPVVDLRPHLICGHRAELAARYLDRKLHMPPMSRIDDHGTLPSIDGVSTQEPCDRVNRAYRG